MDKSPEKKLALQLASAFSQLNSQELLEVLSEDVKWPINKIFSQKLSSNMTTFPQASILNKYEIQQMLETRREPITVTNLGDESNIKVIIQDGEHVIVSGRMNFDHSSGSSTFNENFFLVCQIIDGKVIQVQAFEDTAKILRAYQAI